MKTSTLLISLGAGVLGLTGVFAGTPTGGDYELVRSTVDGGGIMTATGGGFELSSTIGQPDAGQMVGGAFTLSGGFWFEEPPGDCDATGHADLYDLAIQVPCISGPEASPASPDCSCFDFDGDGDVDLLDYAVWNEWLVAE